MLKRRLDETDEEKDGQHGTKQGQIQDLCQIETFGTFAAVYKPCIPKPFPLPSILFIFLEASSVPFFQSPVEKLRPAGRATALVPRRGTAESKAAMAGTPALRPETGKTVRDIDDEAIFRRSQGGVKCRWTGR